MPTTDEKLVFLSDISEQELAEIYTAGQIRSARAWQILKYLQRNGSATARELSYTLRIPKRSVYYGLKVLEKLGLIQYYGRNYEKGQKGRVARVILFVKNITEEAITKARHKYAIIRKSVGKIIEDTKNALDTAKRILRQKFKDLNIVRFWIDTLRKMEIRVRWIDQKLANLCAEYISALFRYIT